MNSHKLLTYLFVFGLFVISIASISAVTIDNEVYVSSTINSNSCMKHSNGNIYCAYESSTNQLKLAKCDSDGLNCVYSPDLIGTVEVYSIFERASDGYLVISHKRSSDNDGWFYFVNEDLDTFSQIEWSNNQDVSYASCFQQSTGKLVCSSTYSTSNDGHWSICNSDGTSCTNPEWSANFNVLATSSFEASDGSLVVGYLDDEVGDQSAIQICNSAGGSCTKKTINTDDSSYRSCYELDNGDIGCSYYSTTNTDTQITVCDSDGDNCATETIDTNPASFQNSFIDSNNKIVTGFNTGSGVKNVVCDSNGVNCETFTVETSSGLYISCFENSLNNYVCGYSDQGNSGYGTLSFLTTSSIVLSDIEPSGDLINKTDIGFNYVNIDGNPANITVYLNDSVVCTDLNVVNGTDYSCDPSITDFTTSYEWYANIVTVDENINTSTYVFTYLPNNITFEDESSNPLENITVDITYPDSSEVSYQTDSNGNVVFPFVYNDIDQYGTYTIDLSGNQGYGDLSISETLTSLNAPLDETYTVENAKINITIYDRETGSLLSGVTVDIEILNLLSDSTTTGNLIIENASIVSQQYTLQAISDGYLTEQRTFTFTNQEVLNLDIYMLNATGENTGFAIISIQDEFYRILSGADVRLLEYDSSALSFIQISQCYADSNGECTFGIELDKKTYIAQATQVINNINYFGQTTTEGERFLEDPSLRTIRLQLLDPFDTGAINNLVYSIDETFSNNVSQIDVDFYTTDGLSTEVCVTYYILDIGLESEYYQECQTSSASIQTIATSVAINRSLTFEARVTQTYQDELFLLDSFYYASELSLVETLEQSNYVRPFIILLFTALLGFSLYVKNVSLFSIGSILLIWFASRTFSSYIILSGASLITLIAGIMLYVARKRKEFN